MRWGYSPALSWVRTWVGGILVSRPRAGKEEAQSNALTDPLPSGEQSGKRQGLWVGDKGQGRGGQEDRGQTRRLLAYSLLCLPRELLGGPQAWPLLLASCLVPGVLQLASLPLLPESPRYLLIDRGDSATCLAGESLTSGP